MPRCVPRLSPPLAGCPHPSRYGAKALCRATFPKGKAKAALESQTPKREAGRLSPQSTELQRCEAQLSPPGRAALIRHGAAQKRSTAPPSPRGRLRRRSKAKPLRGSRDSRSVRLCGNTPSKCVRTAHTHKHFAAKRQNISHAQSAHFTAPKARFHTVSRHATPYFTAAHSGAMCRHSLVSSGSKREWRYRKSRQSGSENTAVHTACGAITV